LARRIIGDQFDTQGIERANELHEGIDIAPNDSLACLHALYGRKRQPRCFRELSLINLEERA